MNIRHIASAAVLAATAIAGPAFAQSASQTRNTAAAAVTTTAQPAASETRRVCVRATGTGTNVQSLVCRTRAQWINEEGFVPGEPRQGR